MIDRGSMAVWGRTAESWGSMAESEARIESAPAPPSPTEEELAAAKGREARQRREVLDLPETATDAECAAIEAEEEAEQQTRELAAIRDEMSDLTVDLYAST